jgi:hypothetical protein
MVRLLADVDWLIPAPRYWLVVVIRHLKRSMEEPLR